MGYLDEDRAVPEDLVRAAGAGLEPARAPRAARAGARRVARRPRPRPSLRSASELGLDMPLEALVSLVYTFNQGIMLERLSGIETGAPRAPRLDRRLAREENAMTVELSAPAAPSRRGRASRTTRATSSATASGSSTRSTARASRRCCSCRRGRSSTRATGRCRSPTSRGTAGCSRSTAAATAAPTGRRSRRVRRGASSPPTRSPSWMRPAPSGQCWWRSRAARNASLLLAAEPPGAGRASWSSSRRPCRCRRRPRVRSASSTVRASRATTTKAGTK